MENNFTLPSVSTNNPESKWVALDFDHNLISEGMSPKEVSDKAKIITENFITKFIGDPNLRYIL